MSDLFEENQSESFDWRHYASIVRRRSWYLLIPLFLVWLLVWGAGWVLPSKYRSSTLILVEQPTVPQQFVVPNVGGDLQDRLQSITQQILSRTHLLDIIQRLSLYEKSQERMTPDDLVERMRKDIEIELVRAPGRDQLTAFNVSFVADDPHVAQQVTSELTNLFINENLTARTKQSESTTEFLGSQLEDARRALAEQEQKVRQFKDQHLGELPGQLQSNLQILSGLQSQLQSEEDALNRAKQQGVYLESLLGQYRSARKSSATRDSAPMGLPALDQELERLRAQLADLSAHYTDRHPDVRKIKEQIARTEQAKERLTTELSHEEVSPKSENEANETTVVPEGIREITPTTELESQLKVNKLELANRQRAIQELQARVGEYQTRLNRSPAREEELAALTRGYDQSQANYDSLLKKKNDSELATSLERRQQGEHFRMLDSPSLPVKPYFPNRPILCLVGLAAGVVVGCATAAGAEMFDQRLYGEKELKDLIPGEIIAQIANINTFEEQSKQQKQAWLTSAAVVVVVATILTGYLISYLHG